MKKYLILFFLTIINFGIFAQGRIFLKYTDPLIAGSSVVSGYAGQVEILNLSYNIYNVVNQNSFGAGPIVSQPSSPGLITFYNLIEKSSPAVGAEFFKATQFNKIEIRMTKGNNPLLEYFLIELEDAIITSIQSVSQYQEKIQIYSPRIKFTYTPYNNFSQAQPNVVKGWDYLTNTANN